MEFVSKQVRSRPGLSQEQALLSLQSHKDYKLGSQIQSLTKQRDRWIAHILEPKVAIFPPKADEEDSSDEGEKKPPFGDDAPDEEKSDGPEDVLEDVLDEDSKDDGDGDGKDKEAGELGEVLSLLHKVVEALGLDVGVDEGLPAGPDGPAGPPPGPHGGPPPGGPGAGPGGPPPVGKPHPKDAPPGVAPMVGFSSTQPRVASFQASTDAKITIKQAKADLERQYPGYKVKQAKRINGSIHALLSVR